MRTRSQIKNINTKRNRAVAHACRAVRLPYLRPASAGVRRDVETQRPGVGEVADAGVKERAMQTMRRKPSRSTEDPGQADPGQIPLSGAHPSREERRAMGKRLRDACPRKSHAAWTAPPGRPDPA